MKAPPALLLLGHQHLERPGPRDPTQRLQSTTGILKYVEFSFGYTPPGNVSGFDFGLSNTYRAQMLYSPGGRCLMGVMPQQHHAAATQSFSPTCKTVSELHHFVLQSGFFTKWFFSYILWKRHNV